MHSRIICLENHPKIHVITNNFSNIFQCSKFTTIVAPPFQSNGYPTTWGRVVEFSSPGTPPASLGSDVLTPYPCLHIHRRLAPPLVGKNGEWLDCVMRTIAVSFTCTAFRPVSSTNANLTVDSIFANFAQEVAHKHQSDGLDYRIGSLTCGSSALGPVALFVCRESREIAMRRYELAFGGVDIDLDGSEKEDWETRRPEDKVEWDRRCLSDPRIWVDFNHDIIFVDGHYRHEINSKCSPREPLTLMRRYASEEASKIRRLAVGAARRRGGGPAISWRTTSTRELKWVIEGNRVYGEEGYEWIPAPGEERKEYLYGFDKVEELLLDNTIGENQDQPGNRNINRSGVWDQHMKLMVLESLTRERLKGPYSGEVKWLEGVRGKEWNEYLE